MKTSLRLFVLLILVATVLAACGGAAAAPGHAPRRAGAGVWPGDGGIEPLPLRRDCAGGGCGARCGDGGGAPVGRLGARAGVLVGVVGGGGLASLVVAHERALARVPDSLDGRYFGPIPASSVIGRALPLWTDEDGDGRFVCRAPTGATPR